MKICTKCKRLKFKKEFSPDKRHKDGLQSACKKCMCLIVMADHKKNPEKYIRKEKERYAKNPEFYKMKTAKWRKENPDKVKNNHKQWYDANSEYSINKSRKWQEEHPVQFLLHLKKYNAKKRNTPKGKLNHCFSRAILHSLTVKGGNKKRHHWEELVDFTIDQLKIHLEKLFQPGMTWENYGKVWEIDHKFPIASFNFNKPEDIEFRLCWSLKNLQPLNVSENRKKHAKIIYEGHPVISAIGGN